MKPIHTLLALAIALASCSTDDSSSPLTPDAQLTREITFHTTTPVTVTSEPITRATLADASLTDLWVLDYAADGTLLQQQHQLSTDTDFGTPTLPLTYGQHRVVFVASRGSSPTATPQSITWGKVSDTFSHALTIDVAAATPTSATAELQRTVACVTVINTDPIPARAASISISLSQHHAALALPTLLVADGGAPFTGRISYLPTDAGTTQLRCSVYSLCTEGFLTDVTVTTTATDGSTISTFTVADVSLEPNRRTLLRGPVFDRTQGMTVTVSDTWLDDLAIDF